VSKSIKWILGIAYCGIIGLGVFRKIDFQASPKHYCVGKILSTIPYSKAGGSVDYEYYYHGKRHFESQSFPFDFKEKGVDIREHQYWVVEVVADNPSRSQMNFRLGKCDGSFFKTAIWRTMEEVPCKHP
jgi:hypothetical protein